MYRIIVVLGIVCCVVGARRVAAQRTAEAARGRPAAPTLLSVEIVPDGAADHVEQPPDAAPAAQPAPPPPAAAPDTRTAEDASRVEPTR